MINMAEKTKLDSSDVTPEMLSMLTPEEFIGYNSGKRTIGYMKEVNMVMSEKSSLGVISKEIRQYETIMKLRLAEVQANGVDFARSYANRKRKPSL
jgi:hypothetical protein